MTRSFWTSNCGELVLVLHGTATSAGSACRSTDSSRERNGGMISVAFVVVFLVGIAIGDILLARGSKLMHTASHDAMAVISLLDSVPPNMR